MSYLEEANYLGDTAQAPMTLPAELISQLSDGSAVPSDSVRIPGVGLVIKRETLFLLTVAAVVVLVLYMTKKKK